MGSRANADCRGSRIPLSLLILADSMEGEACRAALATPSCVYLNYFRTSRFSTKIDLLHTLAAGGASNEWLLTLERTNALSVTSAMPIERILDVGTRMTPDERDAAVFARRVDAAALVWSHVRLLFLAKGSKTPGHIFGLLPTDLIRVIASAVIHRMVLSELPRALCTPCAPWNGLCEIAVDVPPPLFASARMRSVSEDVMNNHDDDLDDDFEVTTTSSSSGGDDSEEDSGDDPAEDSDEASGEATDDSEDDSEDDPAEDDSAEDDSEDDSAEDDSEEDDSEDDSEENDDEATTPSSDELD